MVLMRRASGRTPLAAAPVFLAAALTFAGLGLAGIDAAAQDKAPVARISQEQAVQAALKALSGKVGEVSIEKKRGKNVYVVEIIADKDGEEIDVLVDPESGQVLGMEK